MKKKGNTLVMIALCLCLSIAICQYGDITRDEVSAAFAASDPLNNQSYHPDKWKLYIPENEALEVAHGAKHTVLIKTDGSVWVYGDNSKGQLGDRNSSGENNPRQVDGPTGVTAIGARGDINVAYSIYEGGWVLWAWGSGVNGFIGDGDKPLRISSEEYASSLASKSNNVKSLAKESGVGGAPLRGGSSSGSGTRTVHGYIWPLADDDMWGLGSWFLDQFDIVVELRASFLAPAAPGMSVIATPLPANALGEFTIEDVPYGDYVLVIKRPGYLVRTMKVNVADTDPSTIELALPGSLDKGVFNLWWGDCDDSFKIDNDDVSMIMELLYLKVNAYNPLFNAACDLNNDARCDNEDILMVLENWDCFVRQYAGAGDVGFIAKKLVFSNSAYAQTIPDSGSVVFSADAMVYDEFDQPMSGLTVSYSLTAPYTGVSVNSATGEVTISSNAQPGAVTLKATWNSLTATASLTLSTGVIGNTQITINGNSGDYYYVIVNGRDKTLFNSVTLTYDSTKLQLINIAAQTNAIYTTTGAIPGTGLTVTAVTPGSVTFSFSKAITQGKSWTGAITVFKFKALANGPTNVSVI